MALAAARRARAGAKTARPSARETVARVLADYHRRGTFGGLGEAPAKPGCAGWSVRWFRDIAFGIVLEERRGLLRLDNLLEDLPARDELAAALRAWLAERASPALPPHRRCDPARVRASLRQSGGTLALRIDCLDGDWEHATRRLVHLVNEIYLDVLSRPAHFDRLVEHFGLDPDDPRWPG